MEQDSRRRTVLRGVLAAGCGWSLPTLLRSGVAHASDDAFPAVQAAANPAPPAIDWPLLTKLRIVFGHQSVGKNVLQGIERLAIRDGAKLDIRERRTAPALSGFNHFRIGENGDPASKLRDFAAAADAGALQGADLALMKLCYVDFERSTDAPQVANDYIASLESLARRHPQTRFIAVTAPLVAIRNGPKAQLKKLLAAMHGGNSENAKRTEFNTLLRQHYRAAGSLFDLARIESDGQCCLPAVSWQEREDLRPELTNDGAHLNERGQDLVAGALLGFISAAARKSTA